MPNARVLPPNTGRCSTPVNGRTYTTTNGAYLDVPDFDAAVLVANGWHLVAAGGVATTTNRPANPPKGTRMLDTTLGIEIVWDGAAWRNKITGAAV